MNISIPVGRFFSVPPLRGRAAQLVAISAVAAPTALRFVMTENQGDGFCPYLPFVTLAAMLLDWRAATAVAVASGVIADFLFEGTRFQLFEIPSEITSIIFFGVASGLTIGLARALRKTVADPLWLGAPDPKPTTLIFSRKAGQACVSWHGGRSFVPLGPADEVEKQMRDFLAQQEFGRRLTHEAD
jgi:hypothetical protein